MLFCKDDIRISSSSLQVNLPSINASNATTENHPIIVRIMIRIGILFSRKNSNGNKKARNMPIAQAFIDDNWKIMSASEKWVPFNYWSRILPSKGLKVHLDTHWQGRFWFLICPLIRVAALSCVISYFLHLLQVHSFLGQRLKSKIHINSIWLKKKSHTSSQKCSS